MPSEGKENNRRVSGALLSVILLLSTLIICVVLLIKKSQTDQIGYSRKLDDKLKTERLLQNNNNNNQAQAQAPFLHGVASFDPTPSAVILWTRISISDDIDDNQNVTVTTVDWQISDTMDFSSIVASGSVNTSADQDYTIRVDVVTGLFPSTKYYYKFTHQRTGVDSVTGRTKTAPGTSTTSSSNTNSNSQQVRLATVSCANLQWGYFHAYDRLSERDDIDAILHLGDYIYDYGNSDDAVRDHDPPNETVTLEDYRIRYSQYRSENSLQNLHRLHPFITTWDDHEFTNNAYKTGADGHDPETEGPYIDRRRAAAQAYQEWLPGRITNQTDPSTYNLYRKLQYGDMVDIFVLDTRIVGRDKQEDAFLDQLAFLPGYYQDRNLLGETQMAWLKNGLSTSNAQWKVLMQQVVMTRFPTLGPYVLNSDAWEGYHRDRAELLGYIDERQIDNVVVLAADLHHTYIANIPKDKTTATNVWEYWWNQVVSMAKTIVTLLRRTEDSSIAVEFVTTSVSAPSPEENGRKRFGWLGEKGVAIIWQILGIDGLFIESKSHGYQIVDFQAGKVQSDIYFTGTPREATDTDENQYKTSFYSLNGENFLRQSDEESFVV